MKLNKPKSYSASTHGGSSAFPHATPLQHLRRAVLACLLWEDQFYEDGLSIADRITGLASQVSPQDLASLAIEARSVMHLRHVPLLLLKVLAKTGRGTSLPSETIATVISRADELSEFLAVYWQDQAGASLSGQVKKGLAKAFTKFSPYSLAKYNRDGAIKLRDVMFLTHPKPTSDVAAQAFKALADKNLTPPDTWEVALSIGADKKSTFERLMQEGNLGYLALLRNLRGMLEAKVDENLIRDAILARRNGADKVLPFRYIAAARYAPRFERELDVAMQAAIAELPSFDGITVVMVDVSGSMTSPLSAKSDLRRQDAAAALAALLRGNIRTFSFADHVLEMPPRTGMAMIDAINNSQQGGTKLFDAVAYINNTIKYDRIIVITDEQDTGGTIKSLPAPLGKGYMLNVASYQNGVGYGPWTNISGFSENVIRYIHELELSGNQ